MEKNQFIIAGHSYEEAHRLREKRSLRQSELQLFPYFIKKGETISVNVIGADNNKLYLYTGTPDGDTQHKKAIISGTQSYRAEDDGVLSFVNNNDDGEIVIELLSQHQRMPFFSLGITTNADFKKELDDYKDSPRVLLKNKKADVFVTYDSAKKYIDNAEEMMRKLDISLEAENDISGLVKDGYTSDKLGSGRSLHIENDVYYMYTSHGFMGYSGDAAMKMLLKASSEKWGIWHENGHQHQQEPWTWGGGSGMTETTVNVYSLAAEERILGKVTRLDPYYDEVRTFLADENKDYDGYEQHFVKVCMLWQLRQTFGNAFYPQLHQAYRAMTNSVSLAEDKKQLFIKTTSSIANINLIPFFDKWGVYATPSTIAAMEFLPNLEFPIWENDSNHVHEIALPEKEYIPNLFHLKKSITGVALKNNTTRFIMNRVWYDKYQVKFYAGSQYLGELNNGKPYYCFLSFNDDNDAVIDYNFTSTTDLKELLDSDLFSITAEIKGKHVIYKSSISINRLMDNIKEMYEDESLTEIKDDISQGLLNELWSQYESLTEGEVKTEAASAVLMKLKELQKSVIDKTIKKYDVKEKQSTVTFNNDNYKQYEYIMVTDMSESDTAKLQYGNALPPSTISDKTWSAPVSVKKLAHLYADFKGIRYILKTTYTKETELLAMIDALYSDKGNNILRDDIKQNDIDLCYSAISSSGLPSWKIREIQLELNKAQVLFLRGTIKATYFMGNKYTVEFTDEYNFSHYRYFLHGENGYISEVSYGKSYYSVLRGLSWITDIGTVSYDSIYIKAYHKEWLTIHEEKSAPKWIKVQPGNDS